MVSELAELANDQLFDLETSLTDWPELKAFLKVAFPWNCLGKNLTRFITDCVDKIPVEIRLQGDVSPLAHIQGNLVIVEAGAVVEPGAYVEGPTIIKAGAVVRHAAYVRGQVIICKGAIVGHTSEIKGSILLPEAKAAHFAYVGDSILGCHSNLGAGTKLANLRFDHKNIFIRTSHEKIDTQLKKMGAILGDNAQTGCNSVTNPGCILRPGKFLLPCKNGSGII